MKELYRFRQFLTEDVIKEDIGSVVKRVDKNFDREAEKNKDTSDFASSEDGGTLKDQFLEYGTQEEIDQYLGSLKKDMELDGGEGYKGWKKTDFVEDFRNYVSEKGLTEDDKGHKHTYKQIDPDGTAECTKCGLRNSDPSKTGEKVVKENEDEDYDTDGYVEAMNPEIFDHIDEVIRIFKEWKEGPMTEPGMEGYAKDDLVNYIQGKIRNA